MPRRVARLRGDTAVFSPDSDLVVTYYRSGDDARDWLYETTSGEEIARLDGHTTMPIETAAFSQDSQFIATSGDGTIRLWKRPKP